MTYQARAAVRALAHTAYALGCTALCDLKGAAAHAAAATAWAALSTYVAGIVKLARVPQWAIDAMWVEPAPLGTGFDTDFDDDQAN